MVSKKNLEFGAENKTRDLVRKLQVSEQSDVDQFQTV